MAVAAGREPISEQIDMDRERGAVDYQSAVGSQPQGDSTSLFEQEVLEDFRARWGTVQSGFVDNPGGAVKQADELVVEVMKRLAEVFADERANLEHAWARGEDLSTENLRVALHRYRSFFDRLLLI
jgi:hypothetical protein